MDKVILECETRDSKTFQCVVKDDKLNKISELKNGGNIDVPALKKFLGKWCKPENDLNMFSIELFEVFE